jgi:rhodanese-related sulfurtransferase
METIKTDTLKRWMEDSDRELTVVNVLAPEEFVKAAIPGSTNVPVTASRFAAKVEDAAGDRAATVVVYCAGPECDASPTAARKLEEAGFEDVYDYVGGMEHWLSAGNRVERRTTH